MVKKLAPLALALGLLAGCATAHPKIAELKYNPGRYQDRSVTVDGVVTSSWGVPLVPFKLYKVDDGTGEVTVRVAGRPRADEGRARQRQGPRERVRDASADSRSACTSARKTSSSEATNGFGNLAIGNLEIWFRFPHFQISRFPNYPMILTATAVMSSFGGKPSRNGLDGVEDRVDDRARRELARSLDDLDQPRRAELLAVHVHRLRTRRRCRTRTGRRCAARRSARRRSIPGTIRAARPAARSATRLPPTRGSDTAGPSSRA